MTVLNIKGNEVIEILPLEKIEDYKDHHRLKVFYHKGFTCEICKEKQGAFLAKALDKNGGVHIDVYTSDWTLMNVDHIIAKCDGGKNALENLRPACEPCNSGRHKKLPKTVLQRKMENIEKTNASYLKLLNERKSAFSYYRNELEQTDIYAAFTIVRIAKKSGVKHLEVDFETNELGISNIIVTCDCDANHFIECINKKLAYRNVEFRVDGGKTILNFDVSKSAKKVRQRENKMKELEEMSKLQLTQTKDEILERTIRKYLMKIWAFKGNFDYYNNDVIHYHPDYAYAIAKSALDAGVKYLDAKATFDKKLKKVTLEVDKSNAEFIDKLKKRISCYEIKEQQNGDKTILKIIIKKS